MTADEKAITLGHPSYVWRAGQERRVALIQQAIPLQGRRLLDVGCGLGVYMRRFRELGADVYGVDIDEDKVARAAAEFAQVRQAPAEDLPFPTDHFDIVFSNEVLEHVTDDRQAVREACRVLKPGGHLVVFVPNRLYPFETHGFYWRGRYHFGNIPLINYLPDALRQRLCPHVRAYTRRQVQALLHVCSGRPMVLRCIYAGYDNIVARSPHLGALLRHITYALERTPLQILGLSHFVIWEKSDDAHSL